MPRDLSRRRLLAGLAAGSGAALLGAMACSQRRPPRLVDDDLALFDLSEASRAVRRRAVSPVELTKACLARIERLDPRLNSFVTLTAEPALAAARHAEREIAGGRWRGPLHGIPIAIKDNLDTAGVRTTGGSGLFAERVPTEDAEVVRRFEQAGAVLLGKLNLHELGMGSTSAISHFGPVRNPWNRERMSGGSSGGPAAAVAAGLCFGAPGTDTGGSIRIPAACCGIVGLKPTYGVVSTRGVLPLSLSFDCVGPLARTVADAAWLFRAMTDHPVTRTFDPDSPPPTSGLRVGVLRTDDTALCDRPADAEVQLALEAALDVLRPLVAEVRGAELAAPNLGAIVDAEAYTFHAPYLEATPELYDPRTREALLAGRAIDADELRRLLGELARYRATISEAFARVDLMVVPTLTEAPLALRDAVDPFAGAACTFAFSIGGLPALSLPCGFTRSGLPIGLTIAGPPLAEPRILALALAYERATPWHRRRPPLGQEER